MKVFVTGATGFIGRRLVEQLQRDGCDVIALVRHPNHHLPAGVRTVRGDILSPASLENAGTGCERLFHLAAMISFDQGHREHLMQINGQGSTNILAAARRWHVERSVIVSSACTIGISYSEKHILNEDAPLSQGLAEQNPYLASKLLTEQAAITASQDQAVMIVNPTTVYGPGDFTLNSGTLIKQLTQSHAVPVPPGGSNVVDVDDVVAGIIAAGEKGKTGRRYILGGQNLAFSQIFSTVASVVKHHPLMIPLPFWMRRPMSLTAGMMGRLTGSRFLTPQIIGDLFAFKYFSNERAKQELVWNSKYSFQESVARAWQFYQREGLIK